jgi:hypothetical protein
VIIIKLYYGLDVAGMLRRGQKAVGVDGIYHDYIIKMDEYGDIRWSNGEIVGLNRFFMISQWQVLN